MSLPNIEWADNTVRLNTVSQMSELGSDDPLLALENPEQIGTEIRSAICHFCRSEFER